MGFPGITRFFKTVFNKKLLQKMHQTFFGHISEKESKIRGSPLLTSPLTKFNKVEIFEKNQILYEVDVSDL